MFFVGLLFLIFVLVGITLILLTRRVTYKRLHERALLTNPVYRWTHPKSPKIQKSFLSFSRLLLRSIGVLCLSIGLFVLGLIWATQVSPFRGEPFDHKAWEELGSCNGLSDFQCAEREASCPRGKMVHDLTTNHLVSQETTRAQVISMLGPSISSVDINGSSCPAYSLGMCSGIGIDYDSLFVCFGGDDRVSSTGRVQH